LLGEATQTPKPTAIIAAAIATLAQAVWVWEGWRVIDPAAVMAITKWSIG